MPGSGSGPYVVLTTCLPLGLRPRAGGAQGAWMPCGTPSSGSGPQQGCVPGGDGVCARDPIHGPSRSLQTGLAGALGHLPHSPMSPACRRLLEQVVSCSGLLPGAGLPEDQTVTWFQFHSYLQRQGVSDLEKHFAQLAKEVTLLEELQCGPQARTVRKLQGKRLGQLQPLPQTLRSWALLQLDGPPRACRAASARLAGAARNKSFREKALLFYTNALTENDAKLQQAACVALRHLRGVESIDQIASLCWSDVEAVRVAARETTLSFGEKGRLAFEKMDRLCSQQREAAFGQEADVEITIF